MASSKLYWLSREIGESSVHRTLNPQALQLDLVWKCSTKTPKNIWPLFAPCKLEDRLANLCKRRRLGKISRVFLVESVTNATRHVAGRCGVIRSIASMTKHAATMALGPSAATMATPCKGVES